jgi:hypothetical protein
MTRLREEVNSTDARFQTILRLTNIIRQINYMLLDMLHHVILQTTWDLLQALQRCENAPWPTPPVMPEVNKVKQNLKKRREDDLMEEQRQNIVREKAEETRLQAQMGRKRGGQQSSSPYIHGSPDALAPAAQRQSRRALPGLLQVGTDSLSQHPPGLQSVDQLVAAQSMSRVSNSAAMPLASGRAGQSQEKQPFVIKYFSSSTESTSRCCLSSPSRFARSRRLCRRRSPRSPSRRQSSRSTRTALCSSQ